MPFDQTGREVGRTGIKSDKDLTNAEKIVFGLLKKNKTICTAESMTAGRMGYSITRVPGSSRVYMGGVVTYTRETKKLLLGIDDALMDLGLITPAVSLQMAQKALIKFGTDYACAVTGNAGPSRDDDSAGVGRVYWAVVNKEGDEIVQHFDIFGGRDDVRDKATTHGLRLVRDFIDLHEELEVI